MRIFLFYIFLGGFYFFQNYYSFHQVHFGSDGYGLSLYAIISSIVLYLSGYIFLYHQKSGVLIALFCNLLLITHNINIYIGNISIVQDYKLSYTLGFSLVLQLLLIFHSILYLFISPEIIEKSKFYKSYFPFSIDKKIASIVGSATVIVSVGIVSVLVLFTGVTRVVEREVNWKIEEDKFHRGKKVILIFKEYPNYFFEFYSDKLANKLMKSDLSVLKIKFSYSTDFGNLTGYKVLSIDNDTGIDYGFHLLTSECGNEYPVCNGKPIAPWEEK